jgi:hypothetical protein
MTINTAFITIDNPGQEGCITAGNLIKLLATSDQLSKIASGQMHNSK